jgi:hypothetical protein
VIPVRFWRIEVSLADWGIGKGFNNQALGEMREMVHGVVTNHFGGSAGLNHRKRFPGSQFL